MNNVTCDFCGCLCQETEATFYTEVWLPDHLRRLHYGVDIPAVVKQVYAVCPFCILDPDEPIPYTVTEHGRACLSNSTNLSTDEEL